MHVNYLSLLTDCDSILLLSVLSGMVAMIREKRSEFNNRRHNVDMPRTPFKDSNGATIKECRRKIPDRRRDNMTG